MRRRNLVGLWGIVGLALLCVEPARAAPGDPFAVATFESLGLYWTPPDAAADNEARVRFRAEGETTWRAGYPLWFDNDVPARQGGKYRGSLVHLAAGTSYEIELTLAKTGTTKTFTAKTWNEQFPVGKTVLLPAISDKKLAITESGMATGYVLYTGPPGATIDPKGQEDCISVNASFVIIRGLTLENCAAQGINIVSGHDIVIEENDISGWGRVASDGWGINFDSAVFSLSETLERVIVQRNKLHHPRSDSNSWDESRPFYNNSNHPYGPHAIAFRLSAGNHVFRYNEVYSDDNHQYNDVFGRDQNENPAGEIPERGFPHKDTDIYGNFISHFHDDAFELEGDNRNVRVWGNYFENGRNTVAMAPTIVGPIYFWRNVSFNVERIHKGGRTQWGTALMFLAHNTALKGVNRDINIQNPMITLNNIFQSSAAQAIRGTLGAGSRIDYDLYNGTVPSGTEANGHRGVPTYTVGRFDRATMTGDFALSRGTPGHDKGTVIANFTREHRGAAPDMGAHELDMPPMQYGVNAYRTGAPPLPPVDPPVPSAPDAAASPDAPVPSTPDAAANPDSPVPSAPDAAANPDAPPAPVSDAAGTEATAIGDASGTTSPPAPADASASPPAPTGAARDSGAPAPRRLDGGALAQQPQQPQQPDNGEPATSGSSGGCGCALGAAGPAGRGGGMVALLVIALGTSVIRRAPRGRSR